MFDHRLSRRGLIQSAGGIALGVGALGIARDARADEEITYLFPAPPILPAFGPIRLAQGKGYFKQAGLTVNFATGRGGVDVAKQVGAGNAPIGGIVADRRIATGKSVGMAGVPDWIPPVEAAGVKVNVLPTDEFFPHMAQAVAASDQIIKDKPDMVRAFVKAALHGMKDIMDDPNAAAADFVKFVPEWNGKEDQVKEAFAYYDKLIYPGQKQLGEVDPERVARLQDFYLAKGIIEKKSPVDDLYTNQFIK